MAMTGNSATVTFGTSSFTGSIISIEGNEESIPVLDTSHLGTEDYMTKMVGDLIDAGEFSFEFFLNPNTQAPIGVTETVTITFPVPSGGSSGATLAGSAITNSWSWGTIENNALIRASATVTWAGEITWTDSA